MALEFGKVRNRKEQPAQRFPQAIEFRAVGPRKVSREYIEGLRKLGVSEGEIRTLKAQLG